MREQARAQLFGDLIDLEFKEIEGFYHAEEAEADEAAAVIPAGGEQPQD
jgi:hypothetical protein